MGLGERLSKKSKKKEIPYIELPPEFISSVQERHIKSIMDTGLFVFKKDYEELEAQANELVETLAKDLEMEIVEKDGVFKSIYIWFEELKKENQELKKEIDYLQVRLWDYRAEKWLPNERFLILKDKKTGEQRKIEISKEVKKHIENIEKYIGDVKGDICIFDWGEEMHRSVLNYLGNHLPKILSNNSKKREVESIRDIETILLNEDYKEQIDQRMKDVWNILVDNCRSNWIRFGEIVKLCDSICKKEKVRQYLRIFEEYYILEKKRGGYYKISHEL